MSLHRPKSDINRADLLHGLVALAAVGDEVQHALAQTLGFGRQRVLSQHEITATENDGAVSRVGAVGAVAHVGMAVVEKAQPRKGRQPLQAPLYGIVRAQDREADQDQTPQQAIAKLTLDEYQPRHSQALPFQPLLPMARLIRQMAGSLLQSEAGRDLDISPAVQILARLSLPMRWPRRTWAYAPAHLTVLVDRSMYTRPYWQDQAQYLYALGQWLGEDNLSIFTLVGDPMQPSACWAKGAERVPRLRASTATVLILGDLGQAAVGCVPTRWAQVLRLLAREGARVYVAAPGRVPVLAQAYAAQVARNAHNAPDAHAPAAHGLGLLLTLLSCARRIEPQLVRAMRKLDIGLAAQPELEAQFWACREQLAGGYDGCVWREGAALPYRTAFAGLVPALQKAVWHTLHSHHACVGRAIEVQELLTWACYVDAETTLPFARDIAAAEQWLLAVAKDDGTVLSKQALFDFAQQTFAEHAPDGKLVLRYEKAFAVLWGIATQAQDVPMQYFQLQQRCGQLRLVKPSAKVALSCSPMGMPLGVKTAAITDACMKTELRFVVPEEGQVMVADILPQLSWMLRAAKLAVTLDEVVVPFVYEERGRDQYGLYADLLVPIQLDNVAVWPMLVPARVRFRYIEAGKFLMGSPETERRRFNDEGPQHNVIISQGFWFMATTCTQSLWQLIMGDNPSHFQGDKDNLPVEQVSWLDVQKFLLVLHEHLSKCSLLRLGYQITLPTEAEWEYACRAGTNTSFNFGEKISTDIVNYNGKFDYLDEQDEEGYRGNTLAVRAMSPNAWGLFQMHGNVWEWCADRMTKYDFNTLLDPGLTDALAPDLNMRFARVLRGGGWNGDGQSSRSACRGHDHPNGRDRGFGFRLVLRSQSQASGA